MDKFENINSTIDLSAQWLIPDTQSAMLAIVSSQNTPRMCSRWSADYKHNNAGTIPANKEDIGALMD